MCTHICKYMLRLGPSGRSSFACSLLLCAVRVFFFFFFSFGMSSLLRTTTRGNRDVLHAGRHIFFLHYLSTPWTYENGSKRMRECSRFRKRKSMLFGECGCLLHLKFVWTIIKMLFKSGGLN